MYKLGTKHGILNQLYARNQFTVFKETFITVTVSFPNMKLPLENVQKKSPILTAKDFSITTVMINTEKSRGEYSALGYVRSDVSPFRGNLFSSNTLPTAPKI